jgi:hypothetical protein
MMCLRGGWALLILVGLYGCGLGGRTENIKEGEADYPLVNAAPKHVVALKVMGSSAFRVRLIIGYQSTSSGGDNGSGTSCDYQVGLGVYEPYSVVRDINWVGDDYRGEIALDQYQPGRCKWDFAGAWFTVENSTVQHEELFFNDARPGNAATNRIDLWCIKPPKLTGAHVCGGIRAMRSNFPELISTATVQSTINAGNAHDPPIHISSDGGPLQVELHDLDKYKSDRQATPQ